MGADDLGGQGGPDQLDLIDAGAQQGGWGSPDRAAQRQGRQASERG